MNNRSVEFEDAWKLLIIPILPGLSVMFFGILFAARHAPVGPCKNSAEVSTNGFIVGAEIRNG